MKPWPLLALILASSVTAGGRDDAVVLTAGGDVILTRGVAASARGDWRVVLGGLRDALRGSDVTFVNLESPLTTRPKVTVGIDLRGTPKAVRALSSAGVTVASTVNNHALDGGAAGLTESRRALRTAGVMPLTANVAWRAVRGRRFAFLALQDDGRPWPLRSVRAAARTADAVVVSVHWGAEFRDVTARQRRLAADLVAAGATLVLGHGPHVLQPVERVGQAIVAFSLGNLAFDQDPPSARLSALVRFTLTSSGWVACAVPLQLKQALPVKSAPSAAPGILARLALKAC
ncbi:CapA family protein [Deinococcus yavapaiensis]|uniref:Poly-gamma-glutamate synthesis protein (Capsule biosynthesis protein) n=1 Tax=Deinococcus yavapaiensis KR-236 TaxID=694435 RepID=A0A318SDF7_9DEIO|nr:CapA family protein [Deinococcus yavapaiensis]PYE50428.1 poly-gamma-glutamate synthesis protein (capsule biosynthesis protein) [Deinococcus yavapaiensis KR-236]